MIREYRTVEEIVSPLMMVRQVEGVTYDELVEVQLHDGSIRRGKVLEVNGDTAVVQLFESATGAMVMADITTSATGVTVVINDTTGAGTLAANTYRVVIVG